MSRYDTRQGPAPKQLSNAITRLVDKREGGSRARGTGTTEDRDEGMSGSEQGGSEQGDNEQGGSERNRDEER